jgi:hypothetical protein
MKYALRSAIETQLTVPKPHDMDTNLILANDQAAINAIRAAGANQLFVQSPKIFQTRH